MLVSVVIPTYNRSHLIGDAIDSVLNQTHDELEVIIVDDGSTDGTEQVVYGYDDSRVQLVQHSNNRGGSAARNTGLKHSNGEYVAFLDSDDQWYPTKIEKQVEVLEGCSEDWSGVYCDVESGSNSYLMEFLSAVIYTLPGIERPTDVPKEGGRELQKHIFMLQFSTGGASTLLCKRNSVEEIGGFDEAFPRHQDWEFLIRFLEVGKLAHLDEPLVRKKYTGTPNLETLEKADELFFEKFETTIESIDADYHTVRKIHNFKLAKVYLGNGYFREGINYLLNSRTRTPIDYYQILQRTKKGIDTRMRTSR